MFPVPPSALPNSQASKTAAAKTEDKKDNHSKDICVCVESRDTCSCNDGVIFSPSDLIYEPVYLPSVSEYPIVCKPHK